MFFIILLSSGLGAIGAVARPGVDLVLTLALTAQAGILWWLCAHGRRSVRFSRMIESGSLLINDTRGWWLEHQPRRLPDDAGVEPGAVSQGVEQEAGIGGFVARVFLLAVLRPR